MSAETMAAPVQAPGYFDAVTRLIRQPQRFFAEETPSGLRVPFRILCISAVFHAAVSFTYIYGRSVPLTLILFANSLAIPFIMAGLAWMLQTMTMGRGAGFEKTFAAFAYASSVTLLLSWIPALGMITEPWRLYIAAAGLAKGCGLGWKRGVILLLLSVLLFLMMLWSILPLLMRLKEMVL